MVFEIWLNYQRIESLLEASRSLRLKETLMIKWRGIRLDLLPKDLAKKKELIKHRHSFPYTKRIIF